MNLVNKQVTHQVFGEGIVVKYDDSYVNVKFLSGNKKFVYPDAFEKYLSLMDQRAASLVNKEIQKQKEERRRISLKLIKEKALERERSLEARKGSNKRQRHPQAQSVFWCRSEELDEVFTDWNIFVGLIKSGKKAGQPRRLARMNVNSACLITERNPEMLEKDRRIKGVFMVDQTFDGSKSNDEYIQAHPDYRLCLSEEESKEMLFWNYYANERYPHRMTWNSGRQRYLDNIWMGQILRDIVSLRKNSEGEEEARRFFQYFCKMNGINGEDLPKPSGALMAN